MASMAQTYPLHVLIASLAGLIHRQQAELLEYLIEEYLAHYNTEPNHQGIRNERIDRRAATASGPIECAERLGALLEFY